MTYEEATRVLEPHLPHLRRAFSEMERMAGGEHADQEWIDCLVLREQADPLTDDARAYADKLAEAGVSVRYSEYAGMIHGFVTMGRILPDAGEAISEMAGALREAFYSQNISPQRR